MIALITGATHTGKTCLAQRLLEKNGYPYMSADHLKMGLIRSGICSLTPEDDGPLTEYLWPVEREIIKTAAENGQRLILEGCYVPGNWQEGLGGEYLSRIVFVCLAMTENYIRNNMELILHYESAVERRLYPGCSPETLIRENREYRERFEGSGGLALISRDYAGTIEALAARLSAALDRGGGL
ncbi:MAG: adenylate kinase [Abditibacteriota bacterium]|nr:adenylate kinase [Abditibacteriota bacterium]